MRYDASGADHRASAGRLIYLIGPSGAGKDSLIEAARRKLAAHGVQIARRIITRSAESKGEDAMSVSPERFHELLHAEGFALHWRANGLDYGIPAQVDQWLASGRHVLVNGSRAHLMEARRRYPDLLAIRLDVDPAVLRHRLLARARESIEEIEQRLARNQQLLMADDRSIHVLDNSGTLEAAVEGLLGLMGEEGLLHDTDESPDAQPSR
ncbi:phosphonate metabolism protein/1,5-bisphosphokinase (PRPP-forming) PhnN [Pseudomonas sp. X10]